jgi:hypothetical protein
MIAPDGTVTKKKKDRGDMKKNLWLLAAKLAKQRYGTLPSLATPPPWSNMLAKQRPGTLSSLATNPPCSNMFTKQRYGAGFVL